MFATAQSVSVSSVSERAATVCLSLLSEQLALAAANTNECTLDWAACFT